MRRIRRVFTILMAAILATIMVPPATAQAAEPAIIVEAATLLSPAELFVNGYATCSEPTGQAQIEVFAVQLQGGGLPSGTGSTTINCDSPLGSWGVTITSSIYNPWNSGYLVFGNVQLIRGGVSEVMVCVCVTAW